MTLTRVATTWLAWMARTEVGCHWMGAVQDVWSFGEFLKENQAPCDRLGLKGWVSLDYSSIPKSTMPIGIPIASPTAAPHLDPTMI